MRREKLRARSTIGLLVTIAAVLLTASSAFAASAFQAAKTTPPVLDPAPPPGAQVLKYKFGPMTIKPGQNLIDVDVQKERPAEDGWIVGFRPGLVYADNGKSPSVDVVHLHHAVWLVDFKPTFAAGEEKTNINAPSGYGWRYTTKQAWFLNHMIHDLTGTEQKVYITYTMVFIPDSAPEAAAIKPIHTQWMDVQGIKPYPVFDAVKGEGKKGRLEYPTDVKNAYKADGKVRNQWVVDKDATMVTTAGHLHPGGLWTDLELTRDGKTVNLFRSHANYFEPAGATSWDVSMTATGPNWKVAIKKGDVLSTTATYDTSKASWYEVMGIMVVGITDGPDGGVDPFTGQVDQAEYLTHGRLPENEEPARTGKPNPGLHNPLRARPGPFTDKVTIRNFVYNQGDLSMPGKKGLPPRVRQGQSLEFVNEDDPLTVRFHTITACKAPCNGYGGIRYPLAAGGSVFDSGQLGYGPTISTIGLYDNGDASVPISPVVDVPTAAANCKKDGPSGLVKVLAKSCIGTTVWKTPTTLSPGTYAYFCRIHPFMRGAFQVVPKKAKKKA
jgi:plastocyanin